MALQDHLAAGEQVTAYYKPFYATTQRILRYEKKPSGEEVMYLPYAHLKSVELVRTPMHKQLIMGTLLTITGFYLLLIGFVTSVFALGMGIGLLVYGGIGKEGYYQLHADNLPKKQQAVWRVAYRGSGEFIGTVRKVIGQLPEF